MEQLLQTLRNHITELASDPKFKHHQWYAKYHLEFVELLSIDLLKYYPEADKSTLIAMAWMHDYGKILDYEKQYDHEYVNQGTQKMIELGFDEAFARTVGANIKTLDAKDQLSNANIETQIVSSADGCSHIAGPFISLYWWQNPEVPFEDIMRENIRKHIVDWEQKIVLPEAQKAYAQLHKAALDRANGTLIHI